MKQSSKRTERVKYVDPNTGLTEYRYVEKVTYRYEDEVAQLQDQFLTTIKIQRNMTYTTKQINQDFRIKVFGYNQQGRKINTLVGVSGAIDLIGEAMFEKLIQRAYSSKGDCTICKLRRGIKFSFYIK